MPARTLSMRTPTTARSVTTARSSRASSQHSGSGGQGSRFDERSMSAASSAAGSKRSGGKRSGQSASNSGAGGGGADDRRNQPGRRGSFESKNSGGQGHVKVTEVRRSQLEAKKRLESINRRITELKQGVETADQTVGELTVANRNQSFQIKGEETMLQKELADQQHALELRAEQEALCDEELATQQKELKMLEQAVDQIRLKFIYAFLTSQHTPGVDVEPSEIFGRKRRVSSLIGGRAHAPQFDFDAASVVLPDIYKEPVPNIVTPYLHIFLDELDREKKADRQQSKPKPPTNPRNRNLLMLPTGDDSSDDGGGRTPLTPSQRSGASFLPHPPNSRQAQAPPAFESVDIEIPVLPS
eukprot:TRINITY_DN27229_c0_g1_i1.p1 TRINITY_DN27229_c0_g1~~TRINITY_DN27229_c0_g1_i1.p1  ORF type:complete len:391 (+),score=142.33 TRINITY_DN27229_c0_g1_i1:105-1175(+)